MFQGLLGFSSGAQRTPYFTSLSVKNILLRVETKSYIVDPTLRHDPFVLFLRLCSQAFQFSFFQKKYFFKVMFHVSFSFDDLRPFKFYLLHPFVIQKYGLQKH